MELEKGKFYDESALVEAFGSPKSVASYKAHAGFYSGTYRKTFERALGKRAEFARNPATKQYLIMEVKPLREDNTPQEYEQKFKEGLHHYMAPLILDILLDRKLDEEHKFYAPPSTWGSLLGFVHSRNYFSMMVYDFHMADQFGIPYDVIWDFLSQIHTNMRGFIRRCFQYLQTDGYIGIENIYLVGKEETSFEKQDRKVIATTRHTEKVATEEEIAFYLQCKEEIEKELDIKSAKERWCGHKRFLFRKKLKTQLGQKNIEYVRPGYAVWYKDRQRCEDFLRRQGFVHSAVEDYQFLVNQAFIEKLNINLGKRKERGTLDEEKAANLQKVINIAINKNARPLVIKSETVAKSSDEENPQIKLVETGRGKKKKKYYIEMYDEYDSVAEKI